MNQDDDAENWLREGNWVDKVFDSWVAFFNSVQGDPEEAARLCLLGLKVVASQAILSTESPSSPWADFFRMLIGRYSDAQALCELGLKHIPNEQAALAKLRHQVERILLV